MKYLILILFFCNSLNAQNITITLQKKKNNLKVSIFSNEDLILNTGTASTNIYGFMNKIDEYPMYEDILYLFVYENEKIIPQNKTSILLHPDKAPSFYKKELEKLEKTMCKKYIIKANKNKTLCFDFLVYKDDKEVFKDFPCRTLDCSYDYYTLERGKKYKMQIQLKVNSKIYKSNVVEFTY
ncbi:hypothetical protein PG279_08840 [Riemerella anatipestifer]|uniref:hypothetical protein n=1 Tax=Riemerella anatipestifer TaxID=34085 RepID=UPI0006992570|nr:hypothetical protein [Riemerella anatipestifer]MDY3339280.1 hypothetical protein [Riemerella anatipestifer]